MSKPLFIVKAKEYKVKDGDSLESLAIEAGITWQELTRFNWGTKNPKKINQYLRNKVGCKKKTSDGHNYVFSSADDPGIIYIPEDFEGLDFPTSKSHTIKLKIPNIKTFIPADCIIKFRPKEGWNGEDYGFDWMRKADYNIKGLFGNLDYDDKIVGKLYIPEGAAAGAQKLQNDSNSTEGDFRQDDVLLSILKVTEYKQKNNIKFIGDDSEHDNFASYISIYVNNSDCKPPVKVELQAYITVREEKVDELEFRLDKSNGTESEYLRISSKEKDAFLNIQPNELKKVPIIIECIKPLDSDICISAIAISKKTDGLDHIVEVGRLIVVANDENHRKHINMLLVRVATPALAKFLFFKYRKSDQPILPDMTNQEDLFKKLLRQALINPKIQPTITLDLVKDGEFAKKYITWDEGERFIISGKYNKKDGKLSYADGHIPIEDFLTSRLKQQLIKINSPLKNNLYNYVLAFYFGENGGDITNGEKEYLNGYADGTDGKYVVMFGSKNEGTSPHEFLHALGLPHTFDAHAKSEGVSANAAFSYKPTETENIMDYAHQKGPAFKNSRISLWHWQWKFANANHNAKAKDDEAIENKQPSDDITRSFPG